MATASQNTILKGEREERRVSETRSAGMEIERNRVPEEVFGPDPGGLDTTTQDGGANDENAPPSTHNTESDAECNSGQGKLVRGDLHEELSHIKVVSLAREQGVEPHCHQEEGPEQAEVGDL